MARKYVRFNYFEVQLVPAQVVVLEDLDEEQQVQIPYQADAWDMSGFLDYLMAYREHFRTTVPVGDEYAEIEKDSYSYDQRTNIYGFQLSKLRDKNIPSKKRFGEIKEEILLDQDEFIGEFTSILYDNSYKAVMVQSNLYGLSTKQIEHVLTQLRFRYLDTLGTPEANPLVVKLAPIIDNSKITRVINADYYKKIRIRASDVMLDAVLGENGLLSDTRRMLMESAGLHIDITISMGRTEKTSSLNQENIRNVIEQFWELDERIRPQIELTALENEEAAIETINLVEPRMTDRISIEVEPRTTVAHEFLFQNMLHLYNERRADVRRILRPL